MTPLVALFAGAVVTTVLFGPLAGVAGLAVCAVMAAVLELARRVRQ